MHTGELYFRSLLTMAASDMSVIADQEMLLKIKIDHPTTSAPFISLSESFSCFPIGDCDIGFAVFP